MAEVPPRATPAPTATRSTWVIPFVLGAVVVSDRAFVTVSSGGQGVLPVLTLVAPLAAAAVVLGNGLQRSLGFLVHPAFVVAVLPYMALTAVLPVLGVMFHGYPDRTLLSVTDVTTAVSFLVLGATVWSSASAALARWLPVAIAVEFLYALGQASNWSRGPGWEFFTPLADWDRELAALEGQLGSAGRSTGLFTNPNELGLWACVAAVLAWTLLAGRRRGFAVALAVLTLLLSESRGPAVALLAAGLAGVALTFARGRIVSANAFRAGAALAIVGMLGALAVAFGVVEVSLDRFAVLIQVAIDGPQADVNLNSRFGLWSGVLALNRAYPLGTWGSPELLLGAAVDSAWFRVFAQGSAIYLVSFALLLLAALAVRGASLGAAMAVRGASAGDALRLTAVVVAVAGVTQTSLGSPVTPIFWVLLGTYLQSSMAARRDAPPRHAWAPGGRLASSAPP